MLMLGADGTIHRWEPNRRVSLGFLKILSLTIYRERNLVSDVIADARRAIEKRLSEIRDEEKRLENALRHLGSEVKKRAPGRPKGSKTRKKRAPRGQREKQLLASIKKNPKYTQSEHARAIGIEPNQVYALVAKLTKDGKVKKSKGGTLSLA